MSRALQDEGSDGAINLRRYHPANSCYTRMLHKKNYADEVLCKKRPRMGLLTGRSDDGWTLREIVPSVQVLVDIAGDARGRGTTYRTSARKQYYNY